MNGMTKRNIIVVPCIVKIWLYVSGSRNVFSDEPSCQRSSSACTPPTRKNTKPVIMKRRAIGMLLTVRSQPITPGGAVHVRRNASISS